MRLSWAIPGRTAFNLKLNCALPFIFEAPSAAKPIKSERGLFRTIFFHYEVVWVFPVLRRFQLRNIEQVEKKCWNCFSTTFLHTEVGGLVKYDRKLAFLHFFTSSSVIFFLLSAHLVLFGHIHWVIAESGNMAFI